MIEIAANGSDIRAARVRVRLHDGTEQFRSVVIAEGADGWRLWATEMRFALDNTRFLDVGDAVYRCETIDRIEPINDDGRPTEPMYDALQACLGALTVIRDHADSDSVDVRGLCATLLHSLEEVGFVLTS